MIKQINTTILIVTLSLTSISAENNHTEHKHLEKFDHLKNDVSKESIEKAAMLEVQSLVAKNKIHKSWKHAPISKIGKTHYGDSNDWVVGFDNMKMKMKNRRTLYIFVSVHGEIRGANYTGN